MKVFTLFVKNTKTVRVAPSCGWRGLVFLALAVAIFIPLMASQARALEPAFGQAAEEAAAKLADAFPVVKGSVTGVERDRVLIDLGAKQVYQGMELQVYREGDEVKHPVTGEVLGRRDKKLGLLRVVEVKEKFSEAAIVSREEGSIIRAKDLVRVSSDRLLVALPLIDAGGVKEANVHSVTKDLAIALAKTGHFIVIEDPLLRAALAGEHPSRVESFGDPSTLKLLAEKAHVQLLVLGKLSPGHQGLFLNLQVMSVFTGAPLTVASVEVTERGPMVMAAPSRPSGSTLRPLSEQALTATSRPSSIHSERQSSEPLRAAEQPKGSRSEIASSHKGVVAEEALRKPGAASSLAVAEDGPARSDHNKGLQESVVFELPDPLLALAAGDLDGDQRPEIVGITASEVIVYRWQNQRLAPIARVSSPRSIRHLHIDVGDINGRGHAQIVVTALSGARNDLHSFILELQGGQLVRIADHLGYFLRVVMGPGIETPILVGQRMGELTAFEGPIIRLSWNGERYVEGQPLTLPAQVKNLYEFAPISATGDQISEVAVISEQRVKAYGSEGKPSWESKDDLGEVDHLAFSHIPTYRALQAKYGLKSGIPITPEEYAALQVLPRRVLVEASPLWGNARTELLTFVNPKKIGLFRSESSLPSQVVTFDRQEGIFARGWETTLEGRVRDVALADLNGAGRKDLIVLSAVKEKGLAAYLQDGSRGIISVFSSIR
ncbi:FG-GAP-like repeat-containing protein [Candidatus Methylomirabilis sp.]|uniref:FG-GAP-like repeat-containing protein n=1 Tax=Candidatus Methylomirabilis sp. TaxID=2032687 RepID=UPI002A5C911C|nr:FG-GAP-like repeat-containing protein [Candidatus Methylomirabilis sp.]